MEVFYAADLAQARKLMSSRNIDVAFVDLDGGGKEENTGLRLLEDGTLDQIEVLVMSERDNPLVADEAVRKGASYFFQKPFNPQVIGPLLQDIAEEAVALGGQDTNPGPDSVDQFGYLRGSSKSMRKLYRLIRKVAQSDASLMIVGESGTGKDLVAQTVHALSPRSEAPFIPFNCAAVAENLIASQLFGHEKGSFSGAHSRHRGFFEQAHGGTLFLDEIIEMDVNLQAKLLRVLETRTIRRLGSEKTIKVDVRFISATNRSPERAVAEGTLREDLYYRLAQFPINVPPLRQRGRDICGLAQHFLNTLNEKHGTGIAFSSSALDIIGSKPWPGNVRELKNYVERAYIMSESTIAAESLPTEAGSDAVAPAAREFEQTVSVNAEASLAEAEKSLILASLRRNEGDKKITAAELGISLKTLYNRLREYESQASP